MNKLLKRIAAAIRKHNRYNRTVRELSYLSDRDLADLGINRCDIPNIANRVTREITII
jgi:uncharacterized protein YjiS (DUF1127 family)